MNALPIDRWHRPPRTASGRSCSFRKRDDIEEERSNMTIERWLRLIGGGFVAVSVLLGIFVSVHFLWFTLFVGLNLFQSAFSQWCPMVTILRKAGVRG